MSNKPLILLIEDNPGDVRLIEKALGDAVHVVVARTGSDAMRFLRRKEEHAFALEPDIIILDLNIPSLDGRDLLRLIKGDQSFLHIPVIVLTSSKSEEDITRCYELHANCYVIKPSSWEELRDVVQEIRKFWLATVRLPRRSWQEAQGI